MKHKFLLILLALASALCLVFGLTACGKAKDAPNQGGTEQTTPGGTQSGSQGGGNETKPGGSQTPSKKTYDMSAVVFANVTVTYNGEPQSIFATNLPEGVAATYDGNGMTDAGVYTVTAHFKGDEKNYKPIPDKTAKLTIEKAEYDMSAVIFANVTVTYSGEPQSIFATNLPEGVAATYDGNGMTDAGVYTVTAHFTGEDTKNHEPITDRTVTLKIEKAEYDMSAVVFSDVTVTYNKQPHSILAIGVPAGVTVEYDGNTKTNAGDYIVTAHFTGEDTKNHELIADRKATLKIEKAEYDMSAVTFDDLTVTYDGSIYYVTAKNLPDDVEVSYDNNRKSTAGNYTVTAHFKGDSQNYKEIPDRTAHLVINKAEYDMSRVEFEDAEFSYDGEPHSLYARNLPDGVTVTYDGNNQTEDGEYTVTAHFAGDSQNYKDIPDRTAKLSIVRDFYDIIYHFVGDGVENANPTTVSRNAGETPLLSLECRGYEFVEWCSDEARETPIKSIPANPRQNYHLYAKWASPFRLVDGTLYTLTSEGKAQEYLAINNGIEGVEVTKINARAFNNSLATEIVLPDSVTEIGKNAFYNCGHLESLTTPVVAGIDEMDSNTTYYPFGWFFGTDNLSNTDTLYMNVLASYIYCSASSSSPNYFNAYVPTSLCRLTIHAATLGKFEERENRVSCDVSIFENFSMLKSVWFGKNVILVGSDEFKGCTNLSEVHFENPNIQIDSTAFENTAVYSNSTYRETYREGDNQYRGIYRDGVLLRAENVDSDGVFKIKPGTVTISGGAFATLKTSLKEIEIPNSVTSIGERTFYNCSSLENVTIGNGVTSIGRYVFSGCSGLTGELKIPDSVTSIGERAFEGCSGLTGELKIPDSVTSIGNNAFSSCKRLESVTIGSGVTSIGFDAFDVCSGLTGVYITDLAAWCRIDFNGYYSNPLNYANHLYLDGNEVKDLTIPSEITEIKAYAFYGCSGLSSVTIGSGVTSIGDYAFYNCSGLESVTIGTSVTSIGEYAFSGCNGLTSIEIPDGVTSIGEHAFYNCIGLESVTIGSGVTSIGAYAFAYCTSLTDLIFEAPNGWQKGSSQKHNFDDPLVAALYFTADSEYMNYGWKRVD